MRNLIGFSRKDFWITATSKSTNTVFNTATTKSTLTSTATNTVVFERVTAAGTETEVASASAHNTRYVDGGSWTEG